MSTPPINICQVKPAGNPHAAALDDVADLLYRSISELGYEARQHANKLYPNAINILLGWHLLNGIDSQTTLALQQYPTIVYQLEHLPALFSRGESLHVLRAADTIWDYSETNLEYLETLAEQDPVHVPLGGNGALYHPHNDLAETERDIPVLFYGSSNERRLKIKLAIQEKINAPVLHWFGVYGEERNVLINRAKIVLNLHYYEDPTIFEQARVSYLLSRGAFVLSERSDDAPRWTDMVAPCPTELLPDFCAAYLAQPLLRDAQAALQHRFFIENFPMTANLERPIEDAVARLKSSDSSADPFILPV